MQEWRKRGNYDSILDVILGTSGATEDELKTPAHVDPSQIDRIPEAAERIRDCIQRGTPVILVGDYDADGITATAILIKLLNHFGVQPKAIIPRRFTDGYGISESLIHGISNSLILTIDNGISAIEPIRAAKAAGNTVIIIDHHLPQEELPDADVIVDPHLNPEKNGYEHYCGAGLAYKLAEYMCASESQKQRKTLFFDLLVLACIGTLADVMPLTGDNRYIVMSGLRLINHDPWYRQISNGLRAILNLADRPYDEDTIKFQIAPILNAAGRLYNAGSTSVLKALLSKEDAQSFGYAAKMREINETRKSLVTTWLQAARAAAEKNMETPILIVCCPGMPEGIIGIVAGKLSEEYQRPTFVFSDIAEQPGFLKGSGRTYNDFDLSPMLQVIAPHVDTAGGHAGAAGITVTQENYSGMVEAILQYAEENKPAASDDALYYDLDLLEPELPSALETLKTFAPYGPSVEKPLLVLRGYRCLAKFSPIYQFMGKNKEHVKLFGEVSTAVGFHLAEEYQALGCPETVDLLGTVGENRFNGRTTLQFQIKALRASLE